jgi:hypothetical protein
VVVNSAAKQTISDENSFANRGVAYTHTQLVASTGVRIYNNLKWQEEASSQAFQVCSI